MLYNVVYISVKRQEVLDMFNLSLDSRPHFLERRPGIEAKTFSGSNPGPLNRPGFEAKHRPEPDPQICGCPSHLALPLS